MSIGKPRTAVIPTGDKVQDHEFIYPYYRIQEAGFVIYTAMKNAVRGIGYLGTKVPPDDQCVVTSYENLMGHIDADLLLIPGGAKCMEYLRQEKLALEFIRHFHETGRTIAAICHGTQMLISAKIIKGKRVSGYYSIQDDIENAGATYSKDPVVRDGNIITCPHYKYMGDWMLSVLRAVNENLAY